MLLIVMIPVTTLITGTSLGVEGTIPPLVVGCAPFFARLVETALREVEHGLVEASWSMGGNTWQLIWHTLLPESRAGLIAAVTVTAILLVDYTSMVQGHRRRRAGRPGTIRFGYQRFQTDVMAITVLLLIALVQIVQMSGDRLVKAMSRK
ncbi:ABC transporter permease subunit [Klebsiella michiganensis]|nr:ABC transporter permease subunit [Klebsiella michiganensis]